MSTPEIDIEESQDKMMDFELEIFGTLRRSNSDQSILGKLFTDNQGPKRSLTIEFAQQKPDLSLFGKKPRKNRKKNKCDYRKNICGYIAKKIMRQYLGTAYSQVVQELCEKHGCSAPQARAFYKTRFDKVTGPSHIPTLLIPQNESEIGIKGSFHQFTEWFLEHRYMRHLLLEGKMDDKKAYIEYKNQTLMDIVHNKCSQTSDSQDQTSSPRLSSKQRQSEV